MRCDWSVSERVVLVRGIELNHCGTEFQGRSNPVPGWTYRWDGLSQKIKFLTFNDLKRSKELSQILKEEYLKVFQDREFVSTEDYHKIVYNSIQLHDSIEMASP